MTKHRGLVIFLVASVFLVSLAVFISFKVSKTQSAMRAFVNEEGTWAKAHRDALIHFKQYAYNPDESYFIKYQQSIVTNKKIIEAKINFDKGDFDTARTNLLEAGCHPENIDEVIFLLRNFSWLTTFQHAMGIWDQANTMIQEMDSQIHAYAKAETANERSYLMRQIDYTQSKMIQAERLFEQDFIKLAQKTNTALNTISGLMYFFVAVGLFLVIRKTLNQLTEKEELYEATFNKSRLAYVQYAMNGQILEANQRFADLINTKAITLSCYNFFELIKISENEQLADAVKTGRNYAYEFVFVDGDNSDKFYKANTTIIHNFLGTPLYCVAAIDDITEETHIKRELKKQAHHDFLTGLLNKRAFEDYLSMVCEENIIGHIMFMDLNQFKQVNDVAGHQAGDQVLKLVSQRIKQISGLDHFSRIGGDEFAAFIKQEDIDSIIQIGDEINASIMARPFTFNNQQFDLSISIGISQSTRHCHDKKTLVKQADSACYLSKKSKKVVVYQQWANKAKTEKDV